MHGDTQRRRLGWAATAETRLQDAVTASRLLYRLRAARMRSYTAGLCGNMAARYFGGAAARRLYHIAGKRGEMAARLSGPARPLRINTARL